MQRCWKKELKVANWEENVIDKRCATAWHKNRQTGAMTTPPSMPGKKTFAACVIVMGIKKLWQSCACHNLNHPDYCKPMCPTTNCTGDQIPWDHEGDHNRHYWYWFCWRSHSCDHHDCQDHDHKPATCDCKEKIIMLKNVTLQGLAPMIHTNSEHDHSHCSCDDDIWGWKHDFQVTSLSCLWQKCPPPLPWQHKSPPTHVVNTNEDLKSTMDVEDQISSPLCELIPQENTEGSVCSIFILPLVPPEDYLCWSSDHKEGWDEKTSCHQACCDGKVMTIIMVLTAPKTRNAFVRDNQLWEMKMHSIIISLEITKTCPSG